MSETESKAVGFGDYYPESAGHQPYNEAMAAWYNQVRAMQDEGSLPPSQEPQEVPQEAPEGAGPQESQQAPDPGSQEPQEPAEDEDGPHEVYDPAEHNAPEVMEYLKGVGEAEAERVLESEQAGKNRKGIVNLTDEIMSKARDNDETGSGSQA